MENIIETQPIQIETKPVIEVPSVTGEVAIPQNIPPVVTETSPKIEEKSVVTPINNNEIKPSLGYPINNSLGSEVVGEKIKGDTTNL